MRNISNEEGILSSSIEQEKADYAEKGGLSRQKLDGLRSSVGPAWQADGVVE